MSKLAYRLYQAVQLLGLAMCYGAFIMAGGPTDMLIGALCGFAMFFLGMRRAHDERETLPTDSTGRVI